jgi:hypothetical protein
VQAAAAMTVAQAERDEAVQAARDEAWRAVQAADTARAADLAAQDAELGAELRQLHDVRRRGCSSLAGAVLQLASGPPLPHARRRPSRARLSERPRTHVPLTGYSHMICSRVLCRVRCFPSK